MRDGVQHTFQVLTKRPGIAAHWWETRGRENLGSWPRNVWLGTSVESQKYMPRARVLARIPAPIRFLSVEPMLGPVDLGLGNLLNVKVLKTAMNWSWHKPDCDDIHVCYRKWETKGCRPDIVHAGPPISWVIVGGESGRKPRPMELEWVRSIRDQCKDAGVAFFFKQWGGTNKKEAGNMLDGVQHLEFPR